jgi:Fe-Mn family superoxide dismutase
MHHIGTRMRYEVKDYSKLIGTSGFTETQLKNHFTLYQGYVKNTQHVWEQLDQMMENGQEVTPEFAELKRRFGWEWNGMRLHELYFENFGGSNDMMQAPRTIERIKDSFHSFDGWRSEFKAVGMMRGIGWVVLYHDQQTGNMFNCWINEHDVAHLAGCEPLLIMDVFEHAFVFDYGLKKADYIEAFLETISWEVVEGRLH